MAARPSPEPGRSEDSERRPIHILMRFNDKLFGVGNVVERHRDVIASRGAVWIAKFGRPLGMHRIDQINLQVARGIPTYLFLSQRADGRSEAFRGAVVEMSRAVPEPERGLAPDYYAELGVFEHADFWTKLSELEPMEPGELGQVWIASSRELAPRTLATSMASLFIVHEGPAPGRSVS